MYIVTAEDMYEIDRFAIDQGGIDGTILMENAGQAIAKEMMVAEEKSCHMAILVGSGNNGGDGFVIARYLKNEGYPVKVLQLVPNEKIKGDAAYHKQLLIHQKVPIQEVLTTDKLLECLVNVDIVIDAILGIGVTGEIREPLRGMISIINEQNARIYSVDIPSGLPANENHTIDIAIKADRTYIVEAPKQSLFLETTAPYYGEWKVVPIGIPIEAYGMIPKVRSWNLKDVKVSFPKRATFSHKGSHGKGLVIGGQELMPGSVALSTRAALKAGAGLVTVATMERNIPVIANYCMEAMYQNLSNIGHIDLAGFDGVAIGMGMGRNRTAKTFVEDVLAQEGVPVIIDADGLYHLKELLGMLQERGSPTILTPHYGEMAMLTNQEIETIKKAPFTMAKEFAQEHQVYLILKGKYTIITAPDGTQMVNATGNAGLAKGGTGDVLSGILLAFIMQHESVLEAMNNACFIHGMSADLRIESGQNTVIDLLASDVIDGLTNVFRTMS